MTSVPNPVLRARLEGTVQVPVVAVKFPVNTTHPVTGGRLLDWVRAMSGRRWNPEREAWEINGAGPNITAELLAAGFPTYKVAMTGPGVEEVTEIDDVITPLMCLDPNAPHYVQIWPRLLGYDTAKLVLPKTVMWEAGEGHWRLPLAEAASPGVMAAVVVTEGVVEAARVEKELQAVVHAGASTLAAATGVEESAEVDGLIAEVGDVPEWFGLDLDPYQRAGAIAVAAGHRMLCDEPGLGKTRTALAAAAIVGAARTVIVCPPVVVTAWQREATVSGLAVHPGLAPPNTERKAANPDTYSLADNKDGTVESVKVSVDNVAIIRSGRKVPAIPEHGIVVVPDTLLAARAGLVADLVAWQPDVVLVDEAHREKTWTSSRAKAVRKLAAASRLMSVAITGTPLFANPVELASPLAIAGHLDPTFFGFKAFRNQYAKQNHFKAWVPIQERLPELRAKLDGKVWVRRTKQDVLKDMPPKRRQAQYVDVDRVAYREAHSEVLDEIGDWLDEMNRRPTDEEIDEWCRSSIGMVTRLRKAAGLAKVPVAVDLIVDWIAETGTVTEDGEERFARPLIVWTHHREVSDAMAAAVPKAVGEAGVIMGGTPHEKRAQLVDDFQAGKIPVLVCSVHAAGVGITLTRSSDVLFVETDWTPAIVSQAEDRAHRRGQTMPVMITTLVAPNTLDERVQAVLRRKIGILDDVLTGADHHVAVTDAKSDTATPAEILGELVSETLDEREGKKRAAREKRLAAKAKRDAVRAAAL